MPTNAELAREIEALHETFRKELNNKNSAIITELRKRISEAYNNRFSTIMSEIRDVKESTTFMNKTFEELSTKCDDVTRKNADLKKRNRELADVNKSLRLQVLQLDQYSRCNNLEIRGVPNRPNENLPDLLSSIGDRMSSPIDRAGIDVMHRVPTPGKPDTSNIIVRPVSRDKQK